MKKFNLCRQGVNCSAVSEKISPEELIQLIKDHPQAALVKALRESEYKSDKYIRLKKMLPYVTPHATFHATRKIERVAQISGFIFLDVDKIDLPEGVEVMKKYILDHHADKVALMGTSVGGSGLFMYIRIANAEEMTRENFESVYNYVRTEVFHDVPTDVNAGGVSRVHIIPADPEVYTNLSACIAVPDPVLQNTKTVSSCNKNPKLCCTGGEKFLDIKDILGRIETTTVVDVGDQKVLVKDVEYSKLFVPKVITDGRKHSVYRAMVNSIMFNNPDFKLLDILSYINFVNRHYTGGKPMGLLEMKRTVEAEYDRILETGEYKGLKTKRYHSNPEYDRITRIRMVAEVRGEEQKQRSILLIAEAVRQLKVESADRPTINKVANLLKGKLSKTTINRYWRTVVPKRIVN